MQRTVRHITSHKCPLASHNGATVGDTEHPPQINLLMYTDHIYCTNCTSLATSAVLENLWLNVLVCGVEAGKLWLGFRVLIPELNVRSKFYVL
jgi:hypothetical protein